MGDITQTPLFFGFSFAAACEDCWRRNSADIAPAGPWAHTEVL